MQSKHDDPGTYFPPFRMTVNETDYQEVLRNFIEISYGSLKESGYLIWFSKTQQYLSESDCKDLTALGDRIGKMLWGILMGLKKK